MSKSRATVMAAFRRGRINFRPTASPSSSENNGGAIMVNRSKFCGRRSPLWRTGAIVVLFGVATVHAKMIKLVITLDGCYRVPGSFHVVLNGDENAQPALTPDATRQTWTGEWEDTRRVSFPESALVASGRLGFARTDCLPAKPAKDDAGVVMAMFRFNCDENPVRQMTITTEPMPDRRPIRVSYVRTLTTSQESANCREHGDIDGM